MITVKEIAKRIRNLEEHNDREDTGIIYVPVGLTDDQRKELDQLLENTDYWADNPDAILYAQVNDDGSISIV